MLKIKKIILNLFLTVIFKKKIYFFPFVQTCPKIQLIIAFKDNFILVKNSNNLSLPFLEINLSKKKSIIGSVKEYLNQNISKKISNSSYLNLYLVDSCREIVSTTEESKLFVDNLYIKLDLSDLCTKDDFLENVKISSLDDIKLLQFKNKMNVFDYKMVIKSKKTKAVLIK